MKQEVEEETQYIKYAKRIKELCKRAGIKKHNSKFSNKIYDNYQHATLQCIRQYEQKGYERFVKDLPDKPHLIEFLKLKRIPHFTALDKFAQRIKQTILDLVLAMALARTGIKKIIGGVDGTGNKPNRASVYYVYRLEYFPEKTRKRKEEGPRKSVKSDDLSRFFPL